LLAEIDAPDLDQQIMQAEANLASAKANSVLSDMTLKRGQSLITSYAISQQDLDQRAADAVQQAGAGPGGASQSRPAARARTIQAIVAPFDGLVTARTTDVGALINAGGGGPPLFVVSETSKLRVYVNVPQSYVPSIPVGTKAQISVPEYPGRTFPATVEASAQSVDIASGTTRMQLVVDNSRGELMTGDFTNVSFDLAHPEIAINVPASALIFNQSGLQVAIVGSDNGSFSRRSRSRAIWATRSKSRRGLPRTIAWSSTRRTASPRATRFASPARRERPASPKPPRRSDRSDGLRHPIGFSPFA
jgi:RND family efflux transporter MFP subunit